MTDWLSTEDDGPPPSERPPLTKAQRQQLRDEAAYKRAQIVVLKAIKKHGVWWPGGN